MENPPQQPGFNPLGHLPREVALVIDSVISRMVKKVEPEIQEIAKILREQGSEGIAIQMGVKPQEKKGEPSQPILGIVSPYMNPRGMI